MPRSSRIVVPGAAHHITQRGNSRRDVFLDDDDHAKYLDILQHYCEKYHLRVVAYCIMSNHIHLVAVPGFTSSLADAIGLTHQQYTSYFHAKYEENGHLWQSRFYSCPMDLAHTMKALAYVEHNPVRTGLVAAPWKYTWSSAAAHVGLHGDRLLNLSRWFSEFTAEGWLETLEGMATNTELVKTIRKHTKRGIPLGKDAKFLKQVSACRLKP